MSGVLRRALEPLVNTVAGVLFCEFNIVNQQRKEVIQIPYLG
jgi:hypothetical protein